MQEKPRGSKTMPNPPVPILLVAFGTALDAGRQEYDLVAEVVRRRFPGHPVSWAFTSQLVLKRLAERGEAGASPDAALAALREAGYQQVVVQSFHIVPGEQHAALDGIDTAGLDVSIGAPLLASEADIQAVADMLAADAPPGVPTVVVAHGNNSYPEFNEPNLALDRELRKHRPDLVLASLEGTPGVAPLETLAPRAKAVGKAHFLPLLLVAGGHVQRDVMGDTPAAWRHRIGVPQATCGPPVARHPGLLSIFLQHLAAVVEQGS